MTRSYYCDNAGISHAKPSHRHTYGPMSAMSSKNTDNMHTHTHTLTDTW